MANKELQRKQVQIERDLEFAGVRIRRYTLDPLLKDGAKGQALQPKADKVWSDWLAARGNFYGPPMLSTEKELLGIEEELLKVNRQADLIQRELVSEESFASGIRTVMLLAVALVSLSLLYAMTHGVWSFDFSTFSPLPEWGPLKYVEVAFWSLFGVLCWLLFQATWHLARRDFDRWYQPWYLSTLLRAPFLSIILMMVVLEFVEWYGEGTLIEHYLLEEGNKYYFIVFMSFSLGLMSEETGTIARTLAKAALKFVQNVVGRFSQRLGSLLERTK